MRDHDQPIDDAHESAPGPADTPTDSGETVDETLASTEPAADEAPAEAVDAAPETEEPIFDRDALVVAGLSTPTPPPPVVTNRSRNILIGVGGVLVAGLVAGIVAFNGSEVRTTPEELAGQTPRARSTTVTELAGDPVENETDETDEPLAFTEETTTTVAGQATTGRADDRDAEASVGELAAGRTERLAVFKGGVVYLRGRVPSQEVADTIAARAAAVVGPENVVVEYVIDPDSPMPAAAPLYVEDLVLFAYDSTEIGPDFLPLMELGVALFESVPTVTVEVRGHTDASGPDAYNLDLSQRRVDAVVAYWVSRGIDVERMTGVGMGETDLLDPVNPTSPLNRRVEFIISGILG